ncbi:MAG TPA: hypothetical protein VFV19_04480 [Candidatus Polarisedimenticolaceae bacterium]|nr:hypothetical protein [Candidatus Polarisedimenticolaceae bacterium]
MKTKIIGALAALGLVAAAASAQDVPKKPLRLSGTYSLSHVTTSDDGSVSCDFRATITNGGDNDLDSKIVLRNRNDATDVWGRFGDYTIEAGGNVTVSGSVTVPQRSFAAWQTGRPPLFVYTQDDRGTATMFEVPLSKIPG